MALAGAIAAVAAPPAPGQGRGGAHDYEESAAALDWVQMEQLSAAQRALCRPGCRGLYLPADEAAGAVQMRRGDWHLAATRLVVGAPGADGGDGAALDGDVRIRRPGLLLRGASARVRGDDGASGHIDDASVLLHDAGVHAAAGRIDWDGDRLLLHHSHYSSCPPGEHGWSLQARQLDIDRHNESLVARGVRLRLFGVALPPVPYISMPLGGRRESGLLAPDIGDGGTGLDYTQPIYLNLAPHYDLTLLPRRVAGRGAMAGFVARYLAAHGSWRAQGAWMDDDRIAGRERWFARLGHSGSHGDGRWRTELDYNRMSDAAYLQDLGGDGSLPQSRNAAQVRRYAAVHYRGEHLRLRLDGERYQQARESLPAARSRSGLDLRSTVPLAPGLAAHWRGSWNSFGVRPGTAADSYSMGGERLRMDYGLRWRHSGAWGWLAPGISERLLDYRLDDGRRLQGRAPALRLDMGTSLRRSVGGGWQTLSPRLLYQHNGRADLQGQPHFDHSEQRTGYRGLWRPSRFFGDDMLDDGSWLAFGLASDWQRPAGTMHLALGRAWRTRRSTVQPLPRRSDIMGLWRWRRGGLSLSSDFGWKPGGGLQKADSHLRLQTPGHKLLGLTQSWRRGGERQLQASVIWPLGHSWSGAISWRRHLHEGRWRTLDGALGVRYSNCCWRLGLLWRRQRDSSGLQRSLWLEVQLTGLGGAGERLQGFWQSLQDAAERQR